MGGGETGEGWVTQEIVTANLVATVLSSENGFALGALCPLGCGPQIRRALSRSGIRQSAAGFRSRLASLLFAPVG